MPGFVAIAGASKVEFVGHHVNTLVPIVNVMWVDTGAGPSAAHLAAIAGVFEAQYTANKNFWPASYQHDFTRVTDYNTSTGPQVTDSSGAAVGAGGTACSPQVCGIMQVITAKRGRSFRGRWYFPLDQLLVNADQTETTATWQSRGDLWADDVIAGLAALSPSVVFGVASRKLGTIEPATDITQELQVGTQRRRNGR
jgi:hypothetical protein